jgi:hypothetical protein
LPDDVLSINGLGRTLALRTAKEVNGGSLGSPNLCQEESEAEVSVRVVKEYR